MIKGKRVLERAILTYGVDAQKVMIFEEIAELQKEICKDMRGANNREAIIEETADLMIMLEQLKMMHHITDEEIEKVMKFKLNRLDERMKNGRYKSRVTDR